MKKIIVLLLAVFVLFLIGCGGNNEEVWDDYCDDISFYFDARIYHSNAMADGFEYIPVRISYENMVAETIARTQEVDWFPPIHNFWYEGTKIYVDLVENSRDMFQGTTGERMSSGSIVKTFATFPNVTEIEILIGGERNMWQTHVDSYGAFMIDENGEIVIGNSHNEEIFRAFAD